MIYIIEIDCICLFALLFVLHNMHKKNNLLSSSKYLFRAAHFVVLIIVADILSLLVENKRLGVLSDCIPFNYLINIVYYLGSVSASVYWFMFVEYTIDNTFWSKRSHVVLALIPCYASIILTIMTIFNGILFSIDQNNSYHRGSLFYVNNAICYMYGFASCAHSFIASLKVRDYIKKKQFRLMSLFILFPTLFALIQAFKPEIPTILLGMTIPIIYIYTELLDLQISTDYLTGLNNRNQLMRYLEGAVDRVSRDKDLYLFLIDVDSFKKINDTYGHSEGDFALQKTADVLKEVAQKYGGFVARYGGDEFTYTAEFEKEETVFDVKQFIENRTQEISKTLKYTLSLSVGFTKYIPGLKISEFLLLADSAMYKEKSIRKSKRSV